MVRSWTVTSPSTRSWTVSSPTARSTDGVITEGAITNGAITYGAVTAWRCAGQRHRQGVGQRQGVDVCRLTDRLTQQAPAYEG